MGKNIEYYLSQDFNIEMAEYFSKGRRTIVSVVANDDYTITLGFDNGEKRLYNVAPLIKQDTVFENLAGLSNFSRVYVDDNHCVSWDINPNIHSNTVWNNKITIDSDVCYVYGEKIQ